jgi:L-amino acid N-acyltransferase
MPPAPPPLLRPATPEDAPAIVAIYNDAVARTTASFDTEPRSVEEQARRVGSHDARHPFLVAEDGGEVVGWAYLTAWSDRKGYARTAESSVYIRADRRGQGIGRQLLAELLRSARAAGLHTVLARISGGNPASVRLHVALGFVPVGTMHEVGHKFGRWIDVGLYQWMSETPGRVPPVTAG